MIVHARSLEPTVVGSPNPEFYAGSPAADVAMGQFFQHENGGNSLLIDDFFTADIILREGKGEF